MEIRTGARVNQASLIGAWPRRHVVVGLSFQGCVIAYTDRVNISVAAVAMKEHLGWSQTEKGMVLSAFFVGCMLCMFIAGLLATRFGGKPGLFPATYELFGRWYPSPSVRVRRGDL